MSKSKPEPTPTPVVPKPAKLTGWERPEPTKKHGRAIFNTLALAITTAIISSLIASANYYRGTYYPPKKFSFGAAENDEFTPKWDRLDPSCTISRSTAYEVHNGPNTFSTSAADPINSLKISPLFNKTNWEQWEFDGISHTGISLMMVMFSRDYSYYFFGKGNLRMELFFTTPDGKHHEVLEYLQESTILDCPDYTYGVFNSTGKSYSFFTTKDLKHSKLVFDAPGRIQGVYKLTATTPPVHADGSTPGAAKSSSSAKSSSREVTELSPDLYYSVPVSGGIVEMDTVVGSSSKRFTFKGKGGSARLWAKQGWLGLSESWVALRAWAGPYTIVYWHVVSRVGSNRGKKFPSAHLFYNDELLVGTRLGGTNSSSPKKSGDDFVLDTYNEDGEVSGTYSDKNTGAIFEFVSPAREKRWRFETQHTLLWYELGVGEGLGMSDFADRVVGGEVGGEQFEGRGLTEQARFPEYIPQWAIFLLYGVGFLGNWKDWVLGILGGIVGVGKF